jgi:hypothetical protein
VFWRRQDPARVAHASRGKPPRGQHCARPDGWEKTAQGQAGLCTFGLSGTRAASPLIPVRRLPGGCGGDRGRTMGPRTLQSSCAPHGKRRRHGLSRAPGGDARRRPAPVSPGRPESAPAAGDECPARRAGRLTRFWTGTGAGRCLGLPPADRRPRWLATTPVPDEAAAGEAARRERPGRRRRLHRRALRRRRGPAIPQRAVPRPEAGAVPPARLAGG